MSIRQRLTAKRQIAEWLWRIAAHCSLVWIGRELRLIHEDMLQPAEDPTVTAAAADDIQSSLDELHDDVMSLTNKVDAIMMAMVQLRR